MSSIFGISDLPVSTITSSVQIGGGMDVPQPMFREVVVSRRELERIPHSDKFVPKPKIVTNSNPIINMRNGFGKLMKHFSKVQIK